MIIVQHLIQTIGPRSAPRVPSFIADEGRIAGFPRTDDLGRRAA